MRRAAIIIPLLAGGCARGPAPDPLADAEASFLAFLDAANAAGAIESGLQTQYAGRRLPLPSSRSCARWTRRFSTDAKLPGRTAGVEFNVQLTPDVASL
jgi:hypothetical protein